MGKQTPLYEQHRQAGGRIVDFGGYDMPLHYGSQLHEHRVVRAGVGMFDVSHMLVVDIIGRGACAFLRRLLANDVATIGKGQALYTAMLNPKGGVIDDLIVYCRDEGYRLVLNCGNRDKDLSWLRQVVEKFSVTIQPRNDLSIVAVQGPEAIKKVRQALPKVDTALQQLKVFHALEFNSVFVARTGYTGEEGVEIIVPNSEVVTLWDKLLALRVQPCGLGSRDTLRIEAGLNLYGHEMDETVSPLAANMGWTIAWDPEDRDFIGRQALATLQRQGTSQKLVGLLLEERGVLRAQQKVRTSHTSEQGVVTSGTFSPTLGQSIALARVPNGTAEHCSVELRNKTVGVRVVAPRFVRHGRSLI